MPRDPDHDPPDESKILSAALSRGDFAEIKRLVISHRDYLKRVVELRMDQRLQARLDPSDIVQEAQLEAVQRVADYLKNPAVPVRIWLRKLTCEALIVAQRRHVHAYKRSVKNEMLLPEHSSYSIAQRLLDGASSPSIRFSRKELADKVRSAVARLSLDDQEIILLQAFEGLTSTESAQVLDIKPAAARKRFGRALLRLRALLEDSGLGASQL